MTLMWNSMTLFCQSLEKKLIIGFGRNYCPYPMDSIFENNELFKVLKTNKFNPLAVELNAKGILFENEKLKKKIKPLIQK